jgi:hypothetical protein
MKLRRDNNPLIKERCKFKLLSFLSDIDNEWPKRFDYSEKILGYKNKRHVYKILSPDELTEIEKEAMELLKAKSSKQRKDLYQTLYNEGKKGNIQAIKEFLDRTEGKVKEKYEHTGKDGEPIKTESTLEAGPGVWRVLESLERAAYRRQKKSDSDSNTD